MVALAALAPVCAAAGEACGDACAPVLQLRTGAVETVAAGNLLLDPTVNLEAGVHYVMQLDGPITAERREALAEAGVRLGDYLPLNAYLFTFDEPDVQELAELGFVTWLGQVQSEWKVDPGVGSRTFQTAHRRSLAESGNVQVVITLFAGADPGRTTQTVSGLDGTILLAGRLGEQWILSAVLHADAVAGVAQDEAVEFIEEAPELIPRNNSNGWIVQSNVFGTPGLTPVWDAGIRGEGQIAGLIDGGIILNHCAFYDDAPIGPYHRKLIAQRGNSIPEPPYHGHGTNVASTLAGDAGVYGVPDGFDGIAPAARISFSDFALVQDAPSVYSLLVAAHLDGARVHNNSWGDELNDAYTTLCRQVDRFSRDYEDSLVVFAVTNQATLKSPENAKNVLAVSASRDHPAQDEHCVGAPGPTLDGRRKPEILAPGCGTWCAEAYFDCTVEQANDGTSMAAPVIAGAGLLVRQYFTDGYYPTGAPATGLPFLPSAALIKAVLINGAVDMTGVPVGGNEYPSDQEGWGRALLDNTLHFAGDPSQLWVYDRRNVDGLTTGQQWISPPISVGGDSVPFRVTLVYTEPAAAAWAMNPVVNDLDLEVLGPAGAVYHGNVFSGGSSVQGGAPDRKNNVEQVHLAAPPLGGYTVKVTGHSVAEAAQGFAVVVTGDFSADVIPPDCNRNGVPDAADIVAGTSDDCNANGIPDECEGLSDCNGNGSPDVCEGLIDCNSDGVFDECQALDDCNANGTPDDCESLPDCNYNAAPDTCDIEMSSSDDCQPNAVPDECEVPLATTVYAGPAGAAIPDDNESGIARTLNVPDDFAVADVDLSLRITHDWNGDLIVKLTHDGMTAVLIDRPGHPYYDPIWGFDDDGLDVVLDDWTDVTIESFTSAGPVVAGTFRPSPDPLALFEGQSAEGDWTLTVIDDAPWSTGTLDAWAIHVSRVDGAPEGCYDPGDCNGDDEVDVADYVGFSECLGGPVATVAPYCSCADMNDDGQADLRDFASFQDALIVTRSGPGVVPGEKKGTNQTAAVPRPAAASPGSAVPAEEATAARVDAPR